MKAVSSRLPHIIIKILPLLVCAIFLVHCAHKTQNVAISLYRVVIQVSDSNPKKWNLALNNAENLKEVLGAEFVKIEIVAYGPGLDMLKLNSEVSTRLAKIAKTGVTLYACGTTMRKQKVNKEDLDKTAEIVASGVVEIVEKQKEGYAYIRP